MRFYASSRFSVLALLSFRRCTFLRFAFQADHFFFWQFCCFTEELTARFNAQIVAPDFTTDTAFSEYLDVLCVTVSVQNTIDDQLLGIHIASDSTAFCND